MSLSPQIEQLLANSKVPYSITDAAKVVGKNKGDVVELKPYRAVQATVLKTAQKHHIIALTQSDALVDLDRISHLLGVQCLALTAQELESFKEKHGVSSIPAMPSFSNLRTVVDETLVSSDVVFLGTGQEQQFIKVEQGNFRQLIGDALVGPIASPLTQLEIPSAPLNDKSDIEYSVNLFTEKRIKQRLEETLEFPPLPTTAERIIKLRVDPHADISDLTDIVELDASLAAQVVSWAASPYYSAPGSIKSIHDAIVRVLGFDMVLNLALGLALGNTMKMPKIGPHGCLPYWQQSVFVATATEALVTCIPRAHRPSFGTAYLAGLLNNFGSLVISEVFEGKYKAICECIDANPHASVPAIERHIIGVDRNQLASWLMQFWNMPEAVCTALRHQNDPAYAEEDWEYSLLLLLANKLLGEHGYQVNCSSTPIETSLFERLHIDPSAAREAIVNLLESTEELKMIAKQMGG